MMKKKSVISIAVSLLLIASSYWILSARGSEPTPAKSSLDNTPVVRVTPVAKADIPQSVRSLGSLEAAQRVIISAQDSGRITAINFKSGQQVVKGMSIVQLDNVQAQAAYQSAVSALNVMQTKYRRSKLLVNEAISEQQLQQLQSDVENKKSEVQTAQSALNNKQMIAPFDGVLDTFQAQVGDYVHVGQDIVTLVNTKSLRVDYSIPENNLPKLKVGQLVEVSVSAFPAKKFYGTVSYIAPIVDPTTRSVAVQAMINNDNGLLSPGMFVHVKEQVSVTKDALVLPQESVLADIKGYYVYQVAQNHVAQVYVKIGQRKDNQVQILSGLKLNDVVVSEGQQRLSDGCAVQVMPKST